MNEKAYPLADAKLELSILELIQQASHYKQLKKGANEGTRRDTRSPSACVLSLLVTQLLFLLLAVHITSHQDLEPWYQRVHCHGSRH